LAELTDYQVQVANLNRPPAVGQNTCGGANTCGRANTYSELKTRLLRYEGALPLSARKDKNLKYFDCIRKIEKTTLAKQRPL